MTSNSAPRSQASPASLEGEERALVARVRAGDRAALGVIFRAYYSELCAYADRYVAAAADAEDLVADVFVRVWVERANWDVTQDVRSYLFGAVRNRALNAERNRKVRARRVAVAAAESDALELHAVAPDGERRVMEAEVARGVRQVLASLSPERSVTRADVAQNYISFLTT